MKAVSTAYKTIQDPDKLQRIKEILNEANALIKEKVCLRKQLNLRQGVNIVQMTPTTTPLVWKEGQLSY